MIKPKLRGVSHEIACYFAAAAGAYLVAQVGQGRDLPLHPESPQLALFGVVIYSFCLFFLFASSALYHRKQWGTEARSRMRKLDHSAIYLLIAGTATPIALIATEGRVRLGFLLTLWIGATFGVINSLVWIKAPKKLSAITYVLIGISGLPFIGQISRVIGTTPSILILAGGAIYISGATVYAFKRPDPWPKIFGYHEIFHALVIVAAACHYWAVLTIVRLLT